jgi:uncharacterized protein
MKLCGAIQIGIFTTLMAAALVFEPGAGSLAQTRPSDSSINAGGVSIRKESAPIKQGGTSENRYTTGLVAAAPQSTEFAIAQDIATVLATGQETGPHGEVALRVMPMVGNGGTRNITDILSLPGADMAIAPVVLVDRLRDARTLGDIRNKLVYIAPLVAEEFHLLARPEITRVGDLAGKKVSLGETGSPAAVLGREILNVLGAKIDEVNVRLDAALDGIRKGEISAVLVVSGKPVNLLSRYAPADGLHFLPIPISPALQHDYLRSTLGHEDYPNLIPSGESVETIAIKSALFAYKWPPGSQRFRLLELFVQTLFSHFPEFLSDGHHPKWREVNLSAALPGWQRFRPAERWLQEQVMGETALRNAFNRFVEQNSAGNPVDREKLFREFLRWRERNQGK